MATLVGTKPLPSPCMPIVLLLTALIVYLERRQTKAMEVLQSTVRDTARAVSEAVQAAATAAVTTITPPPPPLPPPNVEETARALYDQVNHLAEEPDEADPTDDIAWLRGERPGAALVNGYSANPFGVQGLTFPPRTEAD